MGDTTVRRLAGPVTVGGRTYRPDDDLTDDVIAQIRNPKAWAVDPEEAAAEAARPKVGGTASGARLATRVTVNGRTYTPDDELPDDVAVQIRNPKVWEGGKVPDLSTPSAGQESKAPSPTEGVGAEATPGPDGDTDGDSGAKPRKAAPRRP